MLRYAHTPELYAIGKSPEKEQEALSLFSSSLEHLDTADAPALGPRSELWTRARLVRRLDPVAEAEAQEQLSLYVVVIVSVLFRPLRPLLSRKWFVSHPTVLPPLNL